MGRHYIVSKWYNVGPDPNDFYMSPKSNIWKDLCSWRGKEFTDEELAGFELENIVGKPCRILVTEYVKRDMTRGAKAERVMKAVPGAPKIDYSDYVRVQDRDERREEAGSEVDVEDDDIPF